MTDEDRRRSELRAQIDSGRASPEVSGVAFGVMIAALLVVAFSASKCVLWAVLRAVS